MALSRAPLVGALLRYAAGLRFRQLFFVTGALFLIDLVIPDLIPFADEIILGLLTLLFGAWKKRGSETPPAAAGGRVIDGEVMDDKPAADPK